MKLSVFYDHIVDAATQSNRSLLEICKCVREYGISAVEMDYNRLSENEEEIIGYLHESELEISCIYRIFDFGHDPNPQPGFELIDTAKRVGAKNVLVIPGFIQKDEDADAALENMKQTVSAVCQYAKAHEITVTMEDFDNKSAPFATVSQVKWFMEQVPGLVCAFDTGNFIYMEEDVLEALPVLNSYIGHLHCKDRSLDIKPFEEPLLTVKGRALYSSPVGSGCIPIKEIVVHMLEQGYEGYFAIEHFGSKQQLEDMKRSSEYLLQIEQCIHQ